MRLAALLIACFLHGPAKAEPVDHRKLLRAIEQVEGADYWRVGKAGERSKFQIMPEVWMQHSGMPFYMASSNWSAALDEQERVALCHIKWLEAHLTNPTPYRIALAWNAGLSAVKNGRFSSAKACYARRVVNLYESED